jgi:DNA polymerase-3 subunit delta'
LGDADLAAVIRSLGPPLADTADPDLARAIGFAEGSVRRAVTLLDADKSGIVADTKALLDELPRLDMKRVVRLAEKVSPRGTEGDLELALDTAMAWVSKGLEARANAGAARLAPLVEVCEKVTRAAREAELYNLDKRPVVISLFGDLADAIRRTG